MANSAKSIICTACIKKITPKAHPGIACGGCGKAQHFNCLNLSTEKKDSYLKGTDNYLCTQCRTKHRRSLSFTATTPSNLSKTSTRPDQTLSSSSATHPQAAVGTPNLILDQTSQHSTGSTTQSQSIVDSSNLVPTLINLVNTLQKTVSSFELRLTEALKEIAILRSSISSPEITDQRSQGTRATEKGKRSFTINGAVHSEGENTDEITEKVLKFFDGDFKINETVTTRRLPARTQTSSPTILITVSTNNVKAIETLKKAIRRSVPGKDIDLPASDKIHINEAHSQETYKLFREARKLKSKGYRFVWIQAGRVLLKKEEGEKIVQLKDLNQLRNLLEAEPVPKEATDITNE